MIASLTFSSAGVKVGYTDLQVEILDPKSIYFEVNADQSEVTNIKEGQKVEVVLDSFRDKSVSGTVSFVGFTPKQGESGTVYKIKVILDESGLKEITPRVGMTGDAKFVLARKNDALYVPPKYIHSDKDGKYVNSAQNVKVRVTIGIEGEDGTEILSGLKEGDVITP
jgi:HlyD family secretion protein/macrolide-specific efflux system membrane fusion protein